MRKQISNFPIESRSIEAQTMFGFRSRVGWTQLEMSEITGISEKTIAQIELSTKEKRVGISLPVVNRLKEFGFDFSKIPHLRIASRGRMPKLKEVKSYYVKPDHTGELESHKPSLISGPCPVVDLHVVHTKLPDHTKFISELLLKFDDMVSEQIKTCEREMDKLSSLESIQKSIRGMVK